MARIRSVHPEICIDEALADTTAAAERTFVRLWPHLDDEGRGVDNIRLLKAALYPLHEDVDINAVDRDLNELASRGLITRYVVDGRRYLATKPEAWARFQKPRHKIPSKLPPPAEGTLWTTPAVDIETNDEDTPSDTLPTHVRHAAAGGERSRRGVGDVGELAPATVVANDVRAHDPAVDRTILAACEILTERHLAAHPSRSPNAHRKSTFRGKLADHQATAERILAGGELTAAMLADLLEPSPTRPPDYVPRDIPDALPPEIGVAAARAARALITATTTDDTEPTGRR